MKSKNTLENYVIDVLFTNSLTIIHCNSYERHIIRDITIEKVGYIKCSNKNLFLPEDHVASITLLQWNGTVVKCEKNKNIIKEEKTYLNIIHKAKDAFKKNPLVLTRVGSVDSSKYHCDDNKAEIDFKHPIGTSEPPTVAEFEKSFNKIPNNVNWEEDPTADLYINKTPKEKSSMNKFYIFGIIIIVFIIIIVISIIIYFYCCQSDSNEPNRKILHVDSDTSIGSNIS
ncbi:unnamed protein product [Adineta steineri]|uniref:Uncharacterized protein n=1 Tax=Adineta steineri TaxID=433720 RepID=A0A814FWS0_9BILA|nr:unnamed protein product [Adineta steineri]CAF4034389.1 unnamed protein product [Adineta steineri]